MLIPFGVFSAGVSSGGVVAGSFDLLETALVSSSVASVTFTTSTYAALGYKHLQIRKIARADVSDQSSHIRFNSDTGSNYSMHQLVGDGSAVSSYALTSQTQMLVGKQPYTSDSNNFTADIIDILDPFATSKNKTIRSLNGYAGTNPVVILRSGAWYNTAAVTSITITQLSGNFVSGSRFSIYGLKG